MLHRQLGEDRNRDRDSPAAIRLKSSHIKVLVIGASGTIGSFVALALAERHQTVRAGSKSGDVRVANAYVKSIEGALTGQVFSVL